MDLTRCNVCEGFLGEVPENYDGPAIYACHCNRERHVEENAHRGGVPKDQGDLNVVASDSTKIGDKVG